MATAKCRSCDHAAGAGAYCSPCAADIMAKALDSFFGGRHKKSRRPHPPKPPPPPRNTGSYNNPVRTIVL